MNDLNDLKHLCENCKKCHFYETRHHMVFGQGNSNADLMFISEAPGQQEDLTGIPFVGKSGQLFDSILASVNITRDEIYIANILKCRPPRNRNPLEDEKKACLPFLRAQVKLIHPKIIVCLGRISAQSIIRPDFKITKEHGIWISRNGYYLIATYHPAALLRDPSKKRDVWEDFKEIRARYETISTKTPN